VTDRQVGDDVANGREWPRARDWNVNLQAVALTPGPLLEVPRAAAVLEYGIGGARYEARIGVPLAGLAWHVCAQWLSVQVDLGAPAVLPPQPVRLTVSVTPGTPRTQTVPVRQGYGSQAEPGAPLILVAPQGAVGLVATTVEYVAGSPTTALDASGEWLYQTPITGLFSVRSPIVPLAQAVTAAATYRTLTQGVSVPQDANAIRLQGAGAGGVHYVRWEVQQ